LSRLRQRYRVVFAPAWRATTHSVRRKGEAGNGMTRGPQQDAGVSAILSGGASWPCAGSSCPRRVATPDRGIGLELPSSTGRGDIEQVQLLIALFGCETGQPVTVHRMQLLQARVVRGEPHSVYCYLLKSPEIGRFRHGRRPREP
jgi:hypothetical protein